MTEHVQPQPIKVPFWTNGTIILGLLAALGIAGYLYRLLSGLGAATNLSNQYPWGPRQTSVMLTPGASGSRSMSLPGWRWLPVVLLPAQLLISSIVNVITPL